MSINAIVAAPPTVQLDLATTLTSLWNKRGIVEHWNKKKKLIITGTSPKKKIQEKDINQGNFLN